jgi:polysaccharide export outer membrane protein
MRTKSCDATIITASVGKNSGGANLQVLFVLVATILAGGCASSKTQKEQASLDADQMQGAQVMEYRIGPSDVLSISVWNREDLSRTVIVRPDGMLSFDLVGDIEAVGLTPMELQQTMEEALGKYINIIPGEVAVVVNEVHSYKVSVLGEVNEPGRFEFLDQVSVLDALAEAGGLTEFAANNDIVILRSNKGSTETIRFDYRRMLKSANPDDKVLVFPGDIILVP